MLFEEINLIICFKHLLQEFQFHLKWTKVVKRKNLSATLRWCMFPQSTLIFSSQFVIDYPRMKKGMKSTNFFVRKEKMKVSQEKQPFEKFIQFNYYYNYNYNYFCGYPKLLCQNVLFISSTYIKKLKYSIHLYLSIWDSLKEQI